MAKSYKEDVKFLRDICENLNIVKDLISQTNDIPDGEVSAYVEKAEALLNNTLMPIFDQTEYTLYSMDSEDEGHEDLMHVTENEALQKRVTDHLSASTDTLQPTLLVVAESEKVMLAIDECTLETKILSENA